MYFTKMRITTILLMISSMALAMPLEPGRTYDQGFETDPTEGKPSQSNDPHQFRNADVKWSIHNLPSFHWSRDGGRTGHGSIRMGKSEGHVILSTTRMAVKPGELIEAKVWARCDRANGQAYLTMTYFNDNKELKMIKGGSPRGSVTWDLQPVGGTRDWSLLVCRGQMPANVNGVEIALVSLNNTDGFVWFDDFSVRNVDPVEWKGDHGGRPQLIDPNSLTPDDYVTVRNNHLSFRGKRLRIWSAFGATVEMPLTYSDIDAEVRRFREHGFNAMRSLWWDLEIDDSYQPGDGSTQDRRDYLIASLGRHKLFLWSDWLNSCQIKPEYVNVVEDPATAAEWEKAVVAARGSKPQLIVREFIPMATDPRCERIYHNYIKKVLAHRNQHNGLTYAEDPTMFTWELMNEDWWIMRVLWGDHLSLPAYFQTQLYKKWNDWLREEYRTTQTLKEKWATMIPGESLENGTVSLLPLMGKTEADKLAPVLGLNVKFTQPTYAAKDFSKERAADVLRFLVSVNAGAKARAEKVFREQGRPGLGSQVVPLIYDTGYAGGILTYAVNSKSSATAACAYVDMSTHDSSSPTFPFASKLKSPPALNDWIDSRRFHNKMAYVYETMTFNPQKYRAEFPYLLLTLIALQDIDVASFHSYGHPIAYRGIDSPYTAHPLEYMNATDIWAGTTMRTDEVLMSAVKVAGEVFKQGYLRPAPDPVVVTLGSDTMWSFDGASGSPYAAAADRTAWHRGFRWAFDPSSKKDSVFGKLVSPIEHAKPVITPTNQIAYRWQEGIMAIDDPRAKVVVGFVPPAYAFQDGLRLRDITVSHPEGMQFVVKDERYVAFGITSEDGKPLAQSAKVVVSAVSTSHNTGLSIDAERMKRNSEYAWGLARSITNPGGTPVLVARVGLTLDAPWLKGRKYRMVDYNMNVVEEGRVDGSALTIPTSKAVYLVELRQGD